MSRQVLTADVTIAATDYQHPERKLKKGHVVELSAAEIAVIGAGNLRAAAFRDTTAEATAVSN
jgi:hypothetical protein